LYHIAVLEIVAMSVNDALRGEQAGAGRLELVSAIELGGLTPSFGTLEGVLDAVEIPVAAMLRPRPSGFCYDDDELWSMQVDAVSLAGIGAKGLVTGALKENGGLDLDSLAALVDSAPAVDWVCHRAFDLTPDPLQAIDQLVALGFKRILSTGGAATAREGIDALRSYVVHAAGRIEIMVAGGVRHDNVAELLTLTGAKTAHAGPFVATSDPSSAGEHPTALAMGGSYLSVDEDEVRALARAVHG
jgi:copper homeostasis protein